MRKQILNIGIIFIFVLWTGIHTTAAQFLPKTVSLSATPQSPSHGETVTIEAATPLFDRNTATFSWTVNGKARPDLSGIGKHIISLGVGGLGTTLNVTVTIVREDGPGGHTTLAIPTADMALTWFAETRIPAWYRGKALPIEDSVIQVIAVPSIIIAGTRIQPKNLIYRWSLDDQTNALVGVGQDVFRIKTSRFSKETYQVNLVVEDKNKRIKKEQDLYLTTFSQRAVIYPFSPLGGIESRQGIGYVFSKKVGLVDFIAEIFNLPLISKKSLQYNWKVKNSSVAGSAENPWLLTLDTERETEAQIPISVTIDDPKRYLPSLFHSLYLVRE